jgi:hypothetical protein
VYAALYGSAELGGGGPLGWHRSYSYVCHVRHHAKNTRLVLPTINHLQADHRTAPPENLFRCLLRLPRKLSAANFPKDFHNRSPNALLTFLAICSATPSALFWRDIVAPIKCFLIAADELEEGAHAVHAGGGASLPSHDEASLHLLRGVHCAFCITSCWVF